MLVDQSTHHGMHAPWPCKEHPAAYLHATVRSSSKMLVVVIVPEETHAAVQLSLLASCAVTSKQKADVESHF